MHFTQYPVSNASDIFTLVKLNIAVTGRLFLVVISVKFIAILCYFYFVVKCIYETIQ